MGFNLAPLRGCLQAFLRLRTYSRVVTPTRLALGERVTFAGQLAGTALLRPMAMAPTAAVLF